MPLTDQSYFSLQGLGLDEYSGEWSTSKVIHLLKRTLFGASVSDINYFSNMSMTNTVDELLKETTTADLPLNHYGSDSAGVASWQTWVNADFMIEDEELNKNRINSLQLWWTGNILSRRRSIHEKMTLFWHNHFAVDMQKDKNLPAKLWFTHYNTLRKNALGNFKQLVKEITLDPAMLIFLNGNANKKTSPNENYGRELQELYTAGKGTASKYTEDDVRSATRVLTGHTVHETKFTYLFNAGEHDDENKQFSNFYSNKIVTGKSGEAGATELDELLTIIFSTDEVAKFICRKIYRFFVYYKIDQETEATVIAPLADIFRRNNYNIQPVLAALFKSQHFYDLSYSSACIIKSPLDFVTGIINEYNIPLPGSESVAAQYELYSLVFEQCKLLQQTLGEIVEVAGWYPYYLEPSFHELWINSVTYSQRNMFTDLIISSGVMINNMPLNIDAVQFAKSLTDPSDPNKLIEDSLQVLLRYPLSAQISSFIKQSLLLSGQTNDHYWTSAWNTYIANPADMMSKELVTTRLNALYKYIMNLPEFQLS